MNALKNSFKNDGIDNAFNIELKTFLRNIEEDKVPSNFTTFYQNNLDDEEIEKRISDFNPDVVAVSCLFSAIEWDASHICAIAKKINASGNSPTASLIPSL